jgi:transposase
MENVLRLYRLPYDERFPVVCFDERPCFLIGDVIRGFEVKPGQVRRQHYEYEKNGSCCLLMAIEPLTGKRIAMVYDQRRKIEYADFMQKLIPHFPKAEKIRLIQDNLNTHNSSSFYENFDAATAYDLTQKFEFHYTPLKGSWLNAVEIEFSAIARACLKKRIPTKKEMETQILAYVKERQKKKITIDWKFDITCARRKMNKHYSKLNSVNFKFIET